MRIEQPFQQPLFRLRHPRRILACIREARVELEPAGRNSATSIFQTASLYG